MDGEFTVVSSSRGDHRKPFKKRFDSRSRPTTMHMEDDTDPSDTRQELSAQHEQGNSNVTRTKKRWEKDYALPPCRVCGAKGTGYHYGVNTCEACKSFFGRSQSKQDELVCSNNQRCLLRPLSRRMCSRCRFKKCLDAGMSIEGVTFGRYTFAKRLVDIKEVKLLGEGKSCTDSDSDSGLECLKQKVKARSKVASTSKHKRRSSRVKATEKPVEPSVSDSPIDYSTSSGISSTSPGTSNSGSACGNNSCSGSNCGSNCGSPLVVVPCVKVEERDVSEMRNMIELVTEAGKKNSYILERNYDEVNQIQRELLLNFDIKISIYEDMAIVHQGDSRVTCFNSVFTIMEKYLQRIVKFAKTIPCFRSLPMIDQITLVKDSFPDLKAFSLYRYVNVVDGTWDNVCHVSRIFGTELSDGVIKMSRRMQSLSLTSQEMDMLRALVIFNADGCDMQEADKVMRTKELLIESMQYLLSQNHPGDSLMFARIIAVLTEMRSFREASRAYYSKVIVDNMKGNTHVQIPKVFQEMLSPQ